MTHDFQNSLTLTAEDVELMACPSIKSQLPVVFPNGMLWEIFTVKCHKCQSPIDHERFRGTVRRPTDHVAELHGHAHCGTCGHRTRCLYRLHDDWRVSGRVGRTWVVWQGKEHLVNWCRRQFARLKSLLF